MPDKSTRVEADPTSGVINVGVPRQADKSTPTDTRVEIKPGTSEHQVMIQEVPHEDDPPESPPAERRRQQTPVHVQVQQQPNSGGLTGIWGQVANFSAVGVLMVLVVIMYRDFISTARERDALIREEMRLSRTNDQAQSAAMVAALGSLTSKMDALAISNNAAATGSAGVVAEFRAARNEDRESRQEMLKVIKMLVAKDKGPDG